MRDAGILDGDLLAVQQDGRSALGADRRRAAFSASGDEVTVKRLERRGREVRLLAENPDFAPIVVDPRRGGFAIEGIAVGIVRRNKGW